MDFDWAKPYPELYKMCKTFQMFDLLNPIKVKYKQLKVFLQSGPECGLVALAMCIGNPTRDIIENLYNTAKLKNYTHNGEMFSINDMTALASEYLHGEIKIFNGFLDCDVIRNFLLEGGVMLVPYDTAKDNSPGFHKGHKAHWAAISGCILTENDFYVIARHGKVRNIAIWKLKVLADSNRQLLEACPNRIKQDIKYKFPEGGIAGPLGLNEKSILIKYL
ncbi:actin maturation protease [Diabrotica undecimpunctata]|uniref:actin maturation protease n=1 Tax=Diabrotica undecimpunctata TaxID=50387 RepID=UPI003B638F36